MNKIQCLIVDDEPLAAEVLQTYIGLVDHLSLAGICHNALEAMVFLQQHKVDLLFLDIRMPRLSGIDFLKALPRRPAVVFTTAYRDYAVEGFDLNVLDYLVKPIPFERFLAAIGKYHAQQGIAAPLASLSIPPASPSPGDNFIYLKADKKMIKVFHHEILYIESLKDYVKVKTITQDIITYQRITYLEEKLPDEKFLRIHRSYIIAIDKIKAFTASLIEVGGEELPVGRLYKEEVMKRITN
ncbi:LytTR family DNA-binding domain-containing protein [Chitinophaga sp. 212800010-3]|uniref:LytR/AlgR family response regulator transcription factor n=1 Tax=unclassified Chitinophaga TaxID=2619133 RepID=UPI002DEDCDF9|nr:Two-component system response regulator [Chitinophaga sp. 212800010-3]